MAADVRGSDGAGDAVGEWPAGQDGSIPLTAIRDVTVNRYNPVCLMTFYVDQANRFSALVCECENEKDAVELARVFRSFQRSKVGDEMPFLKQPGSLNGQVTVPTLENGPKANGHAGGTTIVSAKHEVVVEVEKEHLPQVEVEVNGRPCCSVGVQAALSDCDSDVESSASTMTLQALREELHSLSQEVRDIRDLLQRTGGISTEEYFRRNPGPGSDKYVAVLPSSHVSDPPKGQISEKKVNFAETVRSSPQGVVMVQGGQDQDHDLDFDIRSIGMQTEVGPGGKQIRQAAPQLFAS
ncbi:uncharacterized protein LOC112563250 [Pomacea canaliculata]|nr:uncharacterized protein LOC112563250 [Pomacea canaliculata]